MSTRGTTLWPGRLTGPAPPVESNHGKSPVKGLGRPFGSGGPVQPASFAHVRAASLEQVLDLPAQHGDEARLLAGGQSVLAAHDVDLSAPAPRA